MAAVIAEFAARQQGVVARAQLVAAGVARHRIEYRVKRGALEALHPGVYRVGPVSGRYQREVAALLACAPHGVLSHRTAAALWGLLPEDPAEPVHVTVGRGWRRLGAGVRVHRSAVLPRAEVREVAGMRLTSAARTLLDLAHSLDARKLEECVAQAERDGLADVADLRAVLARHPRHAGSRALRSVMAQAGGPAFTRSEAERRFLELLRRAQLPAPRMNARVRGLEVDASWSTARLVVEIDGRRFHSSPRSFEHDRRRDAILVAAGFRVMRVTWRQLLEEPEAIVARIAQALARAVDAGASS